MNLRELEYLIAVFELKHMSRAAEYCNVSQPTLSTQIKKLEQELGVQLFERTGRQVLPTETGLKIIECARRIITETVTIKELAKAAHDPFSGSYRLGAFPTLASYLFPDLVPLLRHAMPETRLVLIEEKSEQLLEKLLKRQIDAAFLTLPIEADGLVVEHVFDDPFYVAVSPENPLSQRDNINTATLAQEHLLLLEEGHCLRDQTLEFCQFMNAGEDVDFRATSLETLRQMVRANSGVTVMPEIAINKGDSGDIRYLPFEGGETYRSIAFVRRKSSPRAPVFDRINAQLKIWQKTLQPPTSP
ncbi:LysR family transcriptional regulator [Epibacterium sp. SM1969]|uniref:LysR family transcriptional regulator n=1 Tax=Tritonibacter aquimaris TaxID=2663379 RepID=A0A844AVE5_9RHOB|nr:LysR substrate-binding domain-containing protein [Tritonibacter aquimaris]MQY43837.1 LysR family transcriptional regulator [Tritonibacter aquimaris]